MPLTAEQAAKQIADEIKRLGGWKPGNVLDAVIGVSISNTDQLQEMLNKVLTKKGVLQADDEQAIKTLLEQQEAARKKRNSIRVKNGIVIGIAAAVVGAIIYFSVKKKSTI